MSELGIFCKIKNERSIDMSIGSTIAEVSTSRPATRFDRRLAKILEHATAIFCEKGYEGASMRDLSRASGMSLAGLYYYFESKEKLLYLIQKDLFSTVMELLREKLKGVSDPEARGRLFVQNHVEFFLSKPKAMKVRRPISTIRESSAPCMSWNAIWSTWTRTTPGTWPI